ncbi:uncharacterized protein LOC122147693 [Cyprinus carpio]|uniref:Uncharacterized protein LOC122147693 n=1 Tax=Cyprinus carpio TaxID=7962 RepID=A0A9Q9YWD5_CYPCA|nr:uncharacterized protein LOC122147693 [Cyprinus carpio]
MGLNHTAVWRPRRAWPVPTNVFSAGGVPGVRPERFEEGLTVKHCALSLLGEPIMYPDINSFLRLLHQQNISSFLVTNAQFPEEIRSLVPVTQLYVSIDASTKDSLKKIDRPFSKTSGSASWTVSEHLVKSSKLTGSGGRGLTMNAFRSSLRDTRRAEAPRASQRWTIWPRPPAGPFLGPEKGDLTLRTHVSRERIRPKISQGVDVTCPILL